MSNIFFILAWIISGIGSLLLAGVAVTYIRRTWQLIRAEEDDPTHERLLDGLDHLQNQMHLVSQRLGRLEERLEGMERALEGDPTRALPRAAARPSEAKGVPGPPPPEGTLRPSDPEDVGRPSDPSSRRG